MIRNWHFRVMFVVSAILGVLTALFLRDIVAWRIARGETRQESMTPTDQAPGERRSSPGSE